VSKGATDADRTVLAPLFEAKALRAYEYAEAMLEKYPKVGASCSDSTANNNCVGDCSLKPKAGDTLRPVRTLRIAAPSGFTLLTVFTHLSHTSCSCDRQTLAQLELTGRRTLGTPLSHALSPCVQPCNLYYTDKAPEQRLFVAAAALYWLTGAAAWRKAADGWFAKTEKGLFYNNWDNAITQGVAVLASVPLDDVAGAAKRAVYQTLLRDAVSLWATCSNKGRNADGSCKCVASHACLHLHQLQAAVPTCFAVLVPMQSALLPAGLLSCTCAQLLLCTSREARVEHGLIFRSELQAHAGWQGLPCQHPLARACALCNLPFCFVCVCNLARIS
jgi:hypothetical protein